MATELFKGGESVRVEIHQLHAMLDNGWSVDEPGQESEVESTEENTEQDEE